MQLGFQSLLELGELLFEIFCFLIREVFDVIKIILELVFLVVVEVRQCILKISISFLSPQIFTQSFVHAHLNFFENLLRLCCESCFQLSSIGLGVLVLAALLFFRLFFTFIFAFVYSGLILYGFCFEEALVIGILYLDI